MKEIPRVFLKPGREASVLRRHPWLFSGGIARTENDPESGALVALHGANGAFLAWGHYSPTSQIRVRLISWDEKTPADTSDFWTSRLKRALEGRAHLFHDPETTAFRLINAESDGIPGLIVDLYNDTLVLQSLTTGVEARKHMFAELLTTILSSPGYEHPVRSVYERSDVDVRGKEGLKPHIGALIGEEPPQQIEILENGLRFLVDVRSGHKSGFYLDQRENRQQLREVIKNVIAPPSLLNVFSYTGGFTIYGLAGGAISAINVDASSEALRLGNENLALNQMDHTQVEGIANDAFKVLRQLREEGKQFDIIVLDPPKFAFSERDVQRASRGYKDINLQALHLLRSGGLLFTFSCSGAISRDLFQKIVFGAAIDAGCDAQILRWMSQSCDHPVALTFPESAYLKGLICRVIK